MEKRYIYATVTALPSENDEKVVHVVNVIRPKGKWTILQLSPQEARDLARILMEQTEAESPRPRLDVIDTRSSR